MLNVLYIYNRLVQSRACPYYCGKKARLPGGNSVGVFHVEDISEINKNGIIFTMHVAQLCCAFTKSENVRKKSNFKIKCTCSLIKSNIEENIGLYSVRILQRKVCLRQCIYCTSNKQGY